MRISDWSSNVCSSDRDRRARTGRPIAPGAEDGGGGAAYRRHRTRFQQSAHRHFRRVGDARLAAVAGARRRSGALYRGRADGDRARDPDIRSEEHTSELQSLMRISYAVFCLKKKTKKTQEINRSQKNNIM